MRETVGWTVLSSSPPMTAQPWRVNTSSVSTISRRAPDCHEKPLGWPSRACVPSLPSRILDCRSAALRRQEGGVRPAFSCTPCLVLRSNTQRARSGYIGDRNPNFCQTGNECDMTYALFPPECWPASRRHETTHTAPRGGSAHTQVKRNTHRVIMTSSSSNSSGA